MPRMKPAPVVLTLQQNIQSWRQRAQTLRMIAASSRDQSARAVLAERAAQWESKAAEAERAAPQSEQSERA